MRTAIDTSVLLAIREKEPGHELWEELLCAAAGAGHLCICPVVFAELSPGSGSDTRLRAQLEPLAISYDNFSPSSAHLAGCIHWRYRREGGPREHLIPDFLVAAHAQVQCDLLAAIDRGYLRRYFPRLKILRP
ncbi:MAG: type II toxin-antitoxin system VapC family toxin [Verrucomicrobiaceae bacterium]